MLNVNQEELKKQQASVLAFIEKVKACGLKANDLFKEADIARETGWRKATLLKDMNLSTFNRLKNATRRIVTRFRKAQSKK